MQAWGADYTPTTLFQAWPVFTNSPNAVGRSPQTIYHKPFYVELAAQFALRTALSVK
jgi:hypothetical protein